MKCPFCGGNNDRVVDSRESREGEVIRRRRECNLCSRRFTSYETIDHIDYMVIKRDGRREPFDRQKVLKGLVLACKKRPVSMSQLEEIVNTIEQMLHDAPGREVEAEIIGNYIIDQLHAIDDVAYVRFASVYRDFGDITELKQEVDRLFKQHATE
jgi:transcriptional repressor NrdR